MQSRLLQKAYAIYFNFQRGQCGLFKGTKIYWVMSVAQLAE